MKISAATAAPAQAVTSTSNQLQRDQARLAADTRAHADATRIAADKAAIAKDQSSAAGGSVSVHL